MRRAVYCMALQKKCLCDGNAGRRYDIGDIKSYEEVKAVYKGIGVVVKIIDKTKGCL